MSWIRFTNTIDYAINQDKVHTITVSQDYEIIFYVSNSDCFSTSSYETRERAKEVIDDILNNWGKDIYIPSPKKTNEYFGRVLHE